MTVKVLPDGRMATVTRIVVRRASRGRWGVFGECYNLVSGGFESNRHWLFTWRVRTKREARRICRSHLRPSYWVWWWTTPESVRRKAKEVGVRVRIVKSKEALT